MNSTKGTRKTSKREAKVPVKPPAKAKLPAPRPAKPKK